MRGKIRCILIILRFLWSKITLTPHTHVHNTHTHTHIHTPWENWPAQAKFSVWAFAFWCGKVGGLWILNAAELVLGKKMPRRPLLCFHVYMHLPVRTCMWINRPLSPHSLLSSCAENTSTSLSKWKLKVVVLLFHCWFLRRCFPFKWGNSHSVNLTAPRWCCNIRCQIQSVQKTSREHLIHPSLISNKLFTVKDLIYA